VPLWDGLDGFAGYDPGARPHCLSSDREGGQIGRAAAEPRSGWPVGPTAAHLALDRLRRSPVAGTPGRSHRRRDRGSQRCACPPSPGGARRGRLVLDRNRHSSTGRSGCGGRPPALSLPTRLAAGHLPLRYEQHRRGGRRGATRLPRTTAVRVAPPAPRSVDLRGRRGVCSTSARSDAVPRSARSTYPTEAPPAMAPGSGRGPRDGRRCRRAPRGRPRPTVVTCGPRNLQGP
jgi:hypothetical protein